MAWDFDDEDFGFYNCMDEDEEDLSVGQQELIEEFEQMLEQMYGGEVKEADDEDIPEETPPPIPKEATCSHENKVVSHAGGIHFWYCRDCKEDLGDVK